MSILLVDDEPGLTQSVSLNLRAEGWDVITAESGPKALAILDQRSDVEILATDFNMPDMDGAQLVNQALSLKPELYAIVFTGWEDRNYAIRSLRVGADDFIDKDQDFGIKLHQAIRRGFQQVAIERMGRRLLKLTNEQEILDLVFGTLSALGRFDGFCLATRELPGGSYQVERAVDLRTGKEVEARGPLPADSAYRYVIENGKAFYPPVFQARDCQCKTYFEGSQSIIVVPTFLHPTERSALGIEHQEADKFRIDSLRFLWQVGHWISLSMENIANLDKLVRLEGKRAEEDRGLLARSVLHELKNPLSNIATAVQVVMERGHDEELSNLLKNVDRINRVVDSFLQPLIHRSSERQPISLGGVLDEAISRFRVYNPRSGVRLQYEAEPALPSIVGNREMLVTAFVNLLQNGAVAAGDNGRLSIQAHFVPLRDQVEIAFRDDGPGIPVGDLNRIFDYGYTTRGEGHFGHGLALTQEVVQLHGGAITAESGDGPGATFKVALPIQLTRANGIGPVVNSAGV